MTVEHLYLSPAHIYVGHHGHEPGTAPMTEVEEMECVAGSGIRGDRYFDFKPGYKGQVTFFSMDVYEELCARLAEWDRPPSVFRRNILVRGADLNALIGHEFAVQGVRFAGTQEAAPCQWMNRAFAEGAEQALSGTGGLRARVLSTGILRRGPA